VTGPAKSAVAPVYLFACLLLGGSAQGAWQNMVLQLAGIALIAWAAIAPDETPLPRGARLLLWLAIAALAIVMLQLVPLPPALWAHGPRARVAQDLALLGSPLPWLPLSLAPYDSLTALFCLIPPLALLCAVVKLRAYRPSWLAVALIGGTLAGILLGALQVSSPGPNSPWYLYAQTNVGLAVGFFANANHMATLLVVTLPFVAAIGAAGKSRNVQRYSALLTILAAISFVLIAGIALNRSLAGYLLSIPVLAASVLILLRRTSWLRLWIAGGAGIAVIGAAVLLATSAIGGTKIGDDAASSAQSREQIMVLTGHAIRDYFPMGSGLGSFLQVYRTYESPDSVTTEYVIHAHDDYAEIALELGLPGIILMILFLGWWATAAVGVWRDGAANPYARAASIATAAILVHSLVDFPLRTAAISTAFAMCLALLLEARAPLAEEATDLRPTRHLVIR
jgi:O-antigen ligase